MSISGSASSPGLGSEAKSFGPLCWQRVLSRAVHNGDVYIKLYPTQRGTLVRTSASATPHLPISQKLKAPVVMKCVASTVP